MRKKIASVLTIAGSDSSGGAGIQADLKTMTAFGVYGMSAISALTAQNSLGVHQIMEVDPPFLYKQIEVVVSDIFPQSVKTGMISSIPLMEVVVELIQKYRLPNLVIDPVMIATTGKRLVNADAVDYLKKNLFPLATVVTPNLDEAELLSGIVLDSATKYEEAAKSLFDSYGCAFLIKGGHSFSDANDFLFSSSGGRWFPGKRIQNIKPHGCGCTFSTGIASLLAKGHSLESAVFEAKEYMNEALSSLLAVGKGCNPLHHGWKIDH